MARKNNNAGQPNREAQRERRALRVQTNGRHRPSPVYGPGSGSILREKLTYMAEAEKVSA